MSDPETILSTIEGDVEFTPDIHDFVSKLRPKLIESDSVTVENTTFHKEQS